MPNELKAVVRAFSLGRDGELGGLPCFRGEHDDVEIVATRTGIGPQLAVEAAERLLRSGPFERVVVSGIAGGIEGVTVVGELVVPEDVVDAATGERFRADPPAGVTVAGTIHTVDADGYGITQEAIAALRASGIVALDMETAAVARACRDHGVPWVAFRAISDLAGDQSLGEVVMTLVNPDGSPRVGAGLAFLLRHPGRVPRMVRLAREAEAAAATAARAAAAACH
ncbi:MAG: nucleoside phosphorylase [Acidimicrobiales bacterium]|nr:nucleoside phosphorylase [Acidimicrobiales bacterium]